MEAQSRGLANSRCFKEKDLRLITSYRRLVGDGDRKEEPPAPLQVSTFILQLLPMPGCMRCPITALKDICCI